MSLSHLLKVSILYWEQFFFSDLGYVLLVKDGRCSPTIERRMEFIHYHWVVFQVLKCFQTISKYRKENHKPPIWVPQYLLFSLLSSISLCKLSSHDVLMKNYAIPYGFNVLFWTICIIPEIISIRSCVYEIIC